MSIRFHTCLLHLMQPSYINTRQRYKHTYHTSMTMRGATKTCLGVILVIISVGLMYETSASTLSGAMEVDELCENLCQLQRFGLRKVLEMETCKDKCNGYYKKAKMMETLQDHVNWDWKDIVCDVPCGFESWKTWEGSLAYDKCMADCRGRLMKTTLREAKFDWKYTRGYIKPSTVSVILSMFETT